MISHYFDSTGNQTPDLTHSRPVLYSGDDDIKINTLHTVEYAEVVLCETFDSAWVTALPRQVEGALGRHLTHPPLLGVQMLWTNVGYRVNSTIIRGVVASHTS